MVSTRKQEKVVVRRGVAKVETSELSRPKVGSTKYLCVFKQIQAYDIACL